MGRALAILSGMCTGLNPEFNVWGSLVPYAQKLIAEEASSGWEFWLGELGGVVQALLALPRRTETMLGRMERGELDVRVPELTEVIIRLERAIRRGVGGVVFAALLMSGVQLYMAGHVVFATVLLACTSIALAWIILSK